MRQRCPRPECQDEIPPMGGPLSPSASEEIPPRVVRSDRPACDALAAPSQDATATARPVMPPQGDALPLQDVVSKHEVCSLMMTLCFCFTSIAQESLLELFDQDYNAHSMLLSQRQHFC